MMTFPAITKLNDLLDKLNRVRRCGDRAWMACCPAHDDRSPSLKITDVGERLLIHCHAGCAPADIVAAVGLELADLFAGERKTIHPPPRQRKQTDQHGFDKAFVKFCILAEEQGQTLTLHDLATLEQCVRNLEQAHSDVR